MSTVRRFVAPLFALSLVLQAKVAHAGVGGAVISFCFGGGTGELLEGKASFMQCCVEHIFQCIPIFQIFVWVGSIIDNVNNVSTPQVNYLFGTFALGA